MMPDVNVEEAIRLDGSKNLILDIPTKQPAQPGVLDLRLMAGAAKYEGSIVAPCAFSDGAWREIAVALQADETHLHPDMHGEMREVLIAAFAVLASIPRGNNVRITAQCQTTGENEREVAAYVSFEAEGDLSKGIPVDVPDCILDQLPLVRRLERCGNDIAQMFGIKPYDDGSGVAGDFEMIVTKSSFMLDHSDDSLGTKISLRSDVVNGTWNHTTRFFAPSCSEDPMESLRISRDPNNFLATEFDDAEEDNSHIMMLGIGGVDQAEAVSVTIDQENRIYHLKPGSLR